VRRRLHARLGIIKISDVKYGLRASRHFSGFAKGAAAIRAAWESIDGSEETVKLMINSTIGLWNQRDRTKWTVRDTGLFDDMARVDVLVSKGDGPPRCAAATEIVGPEPATP
jgi:hypothetical protein